MQGERPRRAQRKRDEAKETGISIHNFKDFLNSKLDFKLPEGFATFTNEQKIETWKSLLERLRNQTEKLSYQLPDYWKEEQVNLIVQTIESINQDESLDYEYEEMFLGNKKQLVIYKKCREMDEYLQKYRLPKNYDPSLKEVETVAKVIFDLKIKRNIAISLGNKEELDQLNTQMSAQEKIFEEKFKKFQALMRKVLEHFKQQKKRTVINLEIIRQSIYQRLKSTADESDLNIFPRYPDVDNEEFLFIQITKKNELDKYFDNQNLNDQQDGDEIPVSDDQSSYVSDQSQEEKQLQIEDMKRKALPPAGVYSIRYENYEKSIFTLKVTLETYRNKFQIPKILQYGLNDNFQNKIEITNPMADLTINISIEKPGYTCTYFRTKNDFGYSTVKKFKYFLTLDQQLNLVKNGSLFLIGEDKYLIPQQRTRKQNNLNMLTLAVSDFSISSSHVQIADADGNAADWGLFKKPDAEKSEEVVEQNSVFKIVNNSSNMIYQQPGIRLDKNYHIVKCSSGAGYGMFLDAFGAVWVFGKNNCGQLGMKDQLTDQDPVKIKFFEDAKIFITDIKATESLASFAVDSNGMLYRWGLNQFQSTNEPIYDRFGKIINYSLQNYFQQQWTPIPIKKHFETQKIVQIQAGNQFYFILNNQGTLYGWGQCRNLGKGILKDGKEEQIDNICNDIEIMKNVHKVAAGKDHTLVITKEGQVFGWGNLDYLSKQKKGFSQNMVNLTEEYGKLSLQDLIACGPTYTCLYKSAEGKIKLFGDTHKFKESEFDMKQKIRKIECGESVIGLLCEK